MLDQSRVRSKHVQKWYRYRPDGAKAIFSGFETIIHNSYGTYFVFFTVPYRMC
jgi:hypothetical protein